MSHSYRVPPRTNVISNGERLNMLTPAGKQLKGDKGGLFSPEVSNATAAPGNEANIDKLIKHLVSTKNTAALKSLQEYLEQIQRTSNTGGGEVGMETVLISAISATPELAETEAEAEEEPAAAAAGAKHVTGPEDKIATDLAKLCVHRNVWFFDKNTKTQVFGTTWTSNAKALYNRLTAELNKLKGAASTSNAFDVHPASGGGTEQQQPVKDE